MDINNLATVIAPNILYAKSQSNRAQDRISAKDESMLAISAIKCLMDHQERFWTVCLFILVLRSSLAQVPEDIADVLTSESLPDQSTTDLSTKDVLKRYEMILSMKKSHSSRDIYTHDVEEHESRSATIHHHQP